MRQVFAHEAVVRLASGGDPAGPGAAITAELCGSWDHEPPCPLAAHYTSVQASGQQLRVRVLFATDIRDEHDVRHRIRRALVTGVVRGPGGAPTRWTFHDARASEVRTDEADHAQRLTWD